MKTLGCKVLKACTLALLGLASTLLVVQPALAEEASADSWKFSAAGYIWAPSIQGETTSGKDLDVSLSDIIDNFDFAFMGLLEARKGKLSLLVDVIYLDLEDTSNSTLRQGALINLSLTNVELTAWVVTPAVAYNVVESDWVALDLLAGARYLYLKAEPEFKREGPFETTKSSPSGSSDLWDGIVGARGNVKLSHKWSLPFHGDVGTGDTDLTWQIFAGVGYQFNNIELVAGYRHLEWDFDSGDEGGEYLDDLYVSGPVIGIRYFF